MRESRSFADFEEGWKAFLTALEKAWAKLELAAKHSNNSRFQPWAGPYAKLRRTDPLLKYLRHARNADHHTLSDSVNFSPQKLTVKVPGGPGPVYIERLEMRKGRIDYKGSHPLEMDYAAPRLELLRVKDRGEWYNPPNQHLGRPLTAQDPLAVAEQGLAFYRAAIDDAATTLV